MEIKINEKTEQPLLSRTKVKGIAAFEAATASRQELRKKLADSLKTAESSIAVASIKPAFGERKAVFEAHIYKSAQDLEKFESVVVLARHGLREKKAKAGEAKA